MLLVLPLPLRLLLLLPLRLLLLLPLLLCCHYHKSQASTHHPHNGVHANLHIDPHATFASNFDVAL